MKNVRANWGPRQLEIRPRLTRIGARKAVGAVEMKVAWYSGSPWFLRARAPARARAGREFIRAAHPESPSIKGLLFEFGKFFRIIKKLPVEASFRPVCLAPQKGECHGLEAKITNYSGIVLSLIASDKNGKLGDVVLGDDNLNEYIGNTSYFGALIGRYGNRSAKGRFTINAVENGIFIESKNIKHTQKKTPHETNQSL